MIKPHGKIRILFEMVDFHGWEVAAVRDDLKFALKHLSDINLVAMVGKEAMVGDRLWEKSMWEIQGKSKWKSKDRHFIHTPPRPPPIQVLHRVNTDRIFMA